VSGPSITHEILVLAATSWVPFARLVRGTVLSAKERQYVEAARMVGASGWRIVRRHIFPQVLNLFAALAALQVGWMILFDSALSFLGLGVQPPTPSWGSMISEGSNYLYVAPWLSLIPGTAIALTVLSVNAAGRGLAELLDPRARQRIPVLSGTFEPALDTALVRDAAT
jgi:ABC-type dipeptide/oligopeptide/nickel transport system permease subunit